MNATEVAAGIPQPGQVLMGKYRVERVLGVGGMGAVVEAKHIQLDDRVAIKFLLPSMANNEEIVGRFLREGRAAAKIRNEHVVRVFDVGTLDDGSPYMVMEFLEGSDLACVVESCGRMPVTQAVDWLLEACEAIAEAHAAGIVHRDLKPANLFMANRSDGTPTIKVLDFGISKVSNASGESFGMTKTQAVMGSPRYMSPEQMRSSRSVDARSDIWALGTVLHELLSGAPPFDAETMPELCARILADPPPPLSRFRQDLPAGLEDALLLALQKDPVARYQNVAQLAAALAPFGTPAAAVSAQRAARLLKIGSTSDPNARPSLANDPPVSRLASTTRAWSDGSGAAGAPSWMPAGSRGGALGWAVGAAIGLIVVAAAATVGVLYVKGHRTTVSPAPASTTEATPVVSSAPLVVATASSAPPPPSVVEPAPDASVAVPTTTTSAIPSARLRSPPRSPPSQAAAATAPPVTANPTSNPFDDR